jgi:DNA-binding SARP family transcriptional activator
VQRADPREVGRSPSGTSPVLPKLERPAGPFVERKRLFALLDRFRRPIVWIDGPPGAGKASLVSSWIEARALSCLWYRVDESDADPATFFRHLAQSVPADAARLPVFTAERLADLAGFARRFFKALFECMPGLEIVVFDGFHRVAEESALPMLVHELARVPATRDPVRDGLPCMLSIKVSSPVCPPRAALSVVVLSDSPPPPQLSSAIAYGDLTRLHGEDLQPDPEETQRPEAPNDPAESSSRPPTRAAPPQPIQIATLGRFEIVVGGEVLRHARKAPRRALELLKAIIALGPEAVNLDAVAGALWRESRGDAARDAFDVTLHRLRRFLGRNEAVQLVHGMLQVNRELVWVDAATFERLAADANGAHGALDIAGAERALALYQGPFLQNEDEAPWLLPARERLRSRYVRLVIRTAQHFERAGAPARAAEIYAIALEAEPLAEELYRRLMVVLAEQDRRAEALGAYRRCRHMLAKVLGVAPSRDTELLREAVASPARLSSASPP